MYRKDAFNVEGLGKKVIENFWNKKIIKYPYDIFNLDVNILKNFEGWGEKSIANLKNSINRSKKISLDTIYFFSWNSPYWSRKCKSIG